MKLKQGFNSKLGSDMYDLLLIAIKEGAPHIYNEYRARNFSDITLVVACWHRSISEIDYQNIILIYDKLIKIKSFI
jgi:hypothetical protein